MGIRKDTKCCRLCYIKLSGGLFWLFCIAQGLGITSDTSYEIPSQLILFDLVQAIRRGASSERRMHSVWRVFRQLYRVWWCFRRCIRWELGGSLLTRRPAYILHYISFCLTRWVIWLDCGMCRMVWWGKKAWSVCEVVPFRQGLSEWSRSATEQWSGRKTVSSVHNDSKNVAPTLKRHREAWCGRKLPACLWIPLTSKNSLDHR